MADNRVPIDDLDDPRLAMYRHLKAHNLTRDLNQFVLEGEKLFSQLLRSRFPVASVLVSDRCEHHVAGRVPDDAPLFVMPHKRLEELVGFNRHQGVLACGVRVPWPPLDEMLTEAGPHATVVACPQIDNPENLGAILRIADVFGLVSVLIGPRSPDPFSRRVLRVSMGMALSVPIHAPKDLAATLNDLRERLSFELVATVPDQTAQPLESYRPSGRLAVLLGCEAHGLERSWEALCDRRVTIPMRPGAESLNVAVAAGVVLYHVTRR
ncbi:MAG: RNA methyltransferase [Isosphaeraceae bacterium]